MTKKSDAVVVKPPDEQLIHNIRHAAQQARRARERKAEKVSAVRHEEEAQRVASGRFNRIRGLEKLR